MIFGTFFENVVQLMPEFNRVYKGDIKAVSYNRNKLSQKNPYFRQDLDSKKRMFGILAHCLLIPGHLVEAY